VVRSANFVLDLKVERYFYGGGKISDSQGREIVSAKGDFLGGV